MRREGWLDNESELHQGLPCGIRHTLREHQRSGVPPCTLTVHPFVLLSSLLHGILQKPHVMHVRAVS